MRRLRLRLRVRLREDLSCIGIKIREYNKRRVTKNKILKSLLENSETCGNRHNYSVCVCLPCAKARHFTLLWAFLCGNVWQLTHIMRPNLANAKVFDFTLDNGRKLAYIMVE